MRLTKSGPFARDRRLRPVPVPSANGLVIQPAIPVNNCHVPTEAVLANLAALDWTTVN